MRIDERAWLDWPVIAERIHRTAMYGITGRYAAGPVLGLWMRALRTGPQLEQVTTVLDKNRVTRYPVSIRIAETAQKHGIADEDTLHAARLPLRDWDLDDDAVMRIGPARDGRLLEIGIADISSDEPVIFHAMECRDHFHPYL